MPFWNNWQPVQEFSQAATLGPGHFWYRPDSSALAPYLTTGSAPDIAFSRYSNRAPSRSLDNASVFGTIYVWIANSGSFSSVSWSFDGVPYSTSSNVSTGFPIAGNAANGGGRILGLDTTTLTEGSHTVSFASGLVNQTVTFYVFNAVDSTTLSVLLNSSGNSGTTQNIARGNYDLGSPTNGQYYNVARTNWLRLVANGEVIISAASGTGFNFRNNAWVSFEGAWHFVGVSLALTFGNHFRMIPDAVGNVGEIDLNLTLTGGSGIGDHAIFLNGSSINPSAFADFEGLSGNPLYLHHGTTDCLDPYYVTDSTFAHLLSDHFMVLMGQNHGDGMQTLFNVRMTYSDLVFTQQNILVQNNFGPSDTISWQDVILYSSNRQGFQIGANRGYWNTDWSFSGDYTFGHGIGNYVETVGGASDVTATLGAAVNINDTTITLATSNPYSTQAVPLTILIDSEVLEVNSWAGLVGTLEVAAASSHSNGATVHLALPATPYFGSTPPSGVTSGPPTAWLGTSQPIEVVAPGGAIVAAAGASTITLTQSGNGNQNGRVMLAIFGGVVGQTISKSGWTQLLTTSGNGSAGDPAIWVLYRVKQAGDTFVFNISGSSHAVAGRLYNINGADTGTVVDGTAIGSPASVGAGVNVSAPTATAANAASQRWRIACATVTPANSIGVIAGAGQQVNSTSNPVVVTLNAIPASWVVNEFVSMGQEKCQITDIDGAATQVTLTRALEGTQKTTHNGGELIFPFWTRPSYLAVATGDDSDLGIPTSDGLILFKCYEPYPLDALSGDIGTENLNLADAAKIVTASFALKAGVF